MSASVAPTFRLDDKAVLVTGATSGLGQQFARTLVQAGAAVVAAGRRVARLEKLAAEVPGILPVQCDLSRDEDLVALVETARREVGEIDVLVNAAGVADAGPAESQTRQSIEQTLAVDLVAPMRLAALVQPGMKTKGSGSIINVSSISGVVGIGRLPQAAYVAAKTGLIGVTRELALQWARYGIRVNAIAPGFFESEMTEPMYNVDKLADWVAKNTPIQRRGGPMDFDGALLLLASDAGSFITGQTIVVDGGWTAR